MYRNLLQGRGARQGEEGEDQQEAEEGEEGEQEGEEEEGQGSHAGQDHGVPLRGDDPQRDYQAVPQGWNFGGQKNIS